MIAIANALDLEVILVPRKAMPAVQLIARQAAHTSSQQQSSTEPRPAYSLDEDDW
ncbi:hypothetical protein [Pusillimonas sp. ANT_WB101]|uniref:hypothetical protein n=1 Tax=Pusillimonas sp. ANT_WB101 TaxID=2597356 RepID=UPI001CAA88D6|nr:hypothetical protein [Pusillimonas sp. ANT_WB101]